VAPDLRGENWRKKHEAENGFRKMPQVPHAWHTGIHQGHQGVMPILPEHRENVFAGRRDRR
jgi:hypothetical protein